MSMRAAYTSKIGLFISFWMIRYMSWKMNNYCHLSWSWFLISYFIHKFETWIKYRNMFTSYILNSVTWNRVLSSLMSILFSSHQVKTFWWASMHNRESLQLMLPRTEKIELKRDPEINMLQTLTFDDLVCHCSTIWSKFKHCRPSVLHLPNISEAGICFSGAHINTHSTLIIVSPTGNLMDGKVGWLHFSFNVALTDTRTWLPDSSTQPVTRCKDDDKCGLGMLYNV